VLYRETHILLEELAEAVVDGTRKQHMESIASAPLLVIDDFGMRKLPHTAAEDLLEIVMRRYERASTLLTSNRLCGAPHLANAYYERTGDRKFLDEIWPNIEAALRWMYRYGDRDGDGFIEYNRQSHDGLVHLGWKDSDDAIFHADGSLARGSIAACEVQNYAYAAWRPGAALDAALGYPSAPRISSPAPRRCRLVSTAPSGAMTWALTR
jgi:hypothetical protein